MAALDVVRLSILKTYGVKWPLDAFARDLLQNFFDATPDFREVRIDIDRAARKILVRGPVEFDLDLLGYIGATTKNDGTTAGGFGEGFKVCALVGLRDFGLSMRAGSGAGGAAATTSAGSTGNASGSTGAGGASGGDSGDGCGCRIVGPEDSGSDARWIGFGAVALAALRRRPRHARTGH